MELTPFAVEHRYAWDDDAEAPLDRTELITRIHGLLEHIEQQIRTTSP
ncbi:MAG: hypothetical protein HQL73_09020 [Magnetococcales bacterium]|nr:hypothetical protein [Magnetococcales bacterium]